MVMALIFQIVCTKLNGYGFDISNCMLIKKSLEKFNKPEKNNINMGSIPLSNLAVKLPNLAF